MIARIRTLWLKEGGRAALLLALLLNILFFPFIWGNKTFLESARTQPSIMPNGAWNGNTPNPTMTRTFDAADAWLLEPWAPLIEKEYFTEKVLPLWDPYQGFGVPLAANMQSQPFFPLMIAYSTHPSPRTYNWFCLIRLFLAGLFAYFYLRLFVSFIPALTGGAFMMLAGYYVILITMPELSVETLLPLALWTSERLVRAQTRSTILSFAAAIALILLGGMPEAALVTYIFTYSYLIFRFIWSQNLLSRRASFMASAAAGSVLALCFSAVLILPFREFMSNSFDKHQPKNLTILVSGLVHDAVGPSIFTYVAPMLFGPVALGTIARTFNGTRGYFGITGVFFIVLAGLSLASRRNSHLYRDLKPLTLFFGSTVLLVLFKRYGFLINSIGRLPLLQLIQFEKYDEAADAFAVSALIAIGLERLRRGHVSRTLFAIAVLIAAGVIPLALFCSRRLLETEVTSLLVPLPIVTWAISAPVVSIVLISSIALLLLRRDEPPLHSSGRLLVTLLSIVLVLEQMANFVIPTYYVFRPQLPTRSDNPYRGAPFITKLRDWTRDGSRIFADNSLLVPNWASAFGLYDIRNLDALYPEKYLPFARTFISLSDPNHIRSTDLIDRFTGSPSYQFKDDMSRRLLQLSSVKYVASMAPIGTPSNVLDDLLAQPDVVTAMKASGRLSVQTVALGGVALRGLRQPPFSRLPYRLFVPDGQSCLRFSYGLNPSSDRPSLAASTTFTIEIREISGTIAPLFSERIDPESRPADHKWFSGEVDLSAFHGKWVDLLFSTSSNERSESADDSPMWANLRLSGPGIDANSFQLVYDRECKIYRFLDPLPRATIYYGADLEAGNDAVLRRLADPRFDIKRQAVLDITELSEAQRKQASDLSKNGDVAFGTGLFRSRDAAHVSIRTQLTGNGLLVVNDSAYPGWKAYVDGKETSWFPANSLFRGVFLGPGAHLVDFVYRPRSFFTGVWMATAGLIFIAVWMVGSRFAGRLRRVAL